MRKQLSIVMSRGLRDGLLCAWLVSRLVFSVLAFSVLAFSALALTASALSAFAQPALELPIALVIEPPKIVAITDDRFYNQLCGREFTTYIKSPDGQRVPSRPEWGWLSCGGTHHIIDLPSINGLPERPASFYSGEQQFPFLNPSILAAQLRTSLSTDTSFVVLSGEHSIHSSVAAMRKSSGHQGPIILIRAAVTELGRRLSNKSGSGINPLTVLLGGFTWEEEGGVVGIEVSLTNLETGQIITTFYVQGETNERSYRFSLFQSELGVDVSENTKRLISEASKDAFEELAGKLSTWKW